MRFSRQEYWSGLPFPSPDIGAWVSGGRRINNQVFRKIGKLNNKLILILGYTKVVREKKQSEYTMEFYSEPYLNSGYCFFFNGNISVLRRWRV